MNNADFTRARAYYYEFLAFGFFFYGDDDSKFMVFKDQASYLAKSPINDENTSDFEILSSASFSEFKSQKIETKNNQNN